MSALHPHPAPEPVGSTRAQDDADSVPGSPQPRAFLPLFVLAWFGVVLAQNTLIGASIPKVFAFTDADSKGIDLSIVAAIGGIVVMLVTPIAGRLSDRTMSQHGMRRPWIVGGAVVGAAGSVVLAFSASLWVVVLGWAVVQAGFGAANAAIHALLADQIPTRIRARVAGIASATSGLALVGGALVIAALPNDAQWLWFLIPGVGGALLTGLLFFGLRDIVRTEPPAPLTWRAVLGSYWLDPRQYRDFFWAWACRLFVTMSIVSVATYMLFFIIDHLGIPKEQASEVQASTLIIFTLGNVITAVLFGWISDRSGRRKPVIWVSCLLSATGLVIAIVAPDVTMFMVGIGIVGAAQGAFISVDIALMTEVLPSYDEVGKDLGIVALSYFLPQLLVPIVAVPLLALGGGDNYTALFIAAIVFGVLGGLAVLPIRGAR